MQLGVISDSHNDYLKTKKVLDFLKNKGIKYLVHAGDWDNEEILYLFLKYDFYVFGVLGNCDGNINSYKEIIRKNNRFKLEENYLLQSLKGFDFAVHHGNDINIMEKLKKDNNIDFIFTGHTHKPLINKNQSKPTIINPGSVAGNRLENFNKITFSIVDLLNKKGRIISIN